MATGEIESGKCFRGEPCGNLSLARFSLPHPPTRSLFPPCHPGVRSDLNPVAMRLARDHVLCSDDGAKAWNSVAFADYDVYIWVAGPKGTCVLWKGDGGINAMKAHVPRAEVKEYVDAVMILHPALSAQVLMPAQMRHTSLPAHIIRDTLFTVTLPRNS